MNNFKIKLPKADKTLKQPYTDAELSILLKKPDIKKCSFPEYGSWVIINYLIATGNRASTVINIKIGDVDFDNQCIQLTKLKNRKQQIIPLSSTLQHVLREYLKFRKGKTDDYLFCGIHGEQMTVNSLSISIRSYNRKRGVIKTAMSLS